MASSTTPSTAASALDKSPPNANSEPPTSSNLTTPPLAASPPPTSPPPATSPPSTVASPPPPTLSPPPVSASPPTLMASPPPPSTSSPSPPLLASPPSPPSPTTSSSHPITVPPPTSSKPPRSTQPPTDSPSPPVNTPPASSSQLPSNSSAATPPPRNMSVPSPSPPRNPSLTSPPTNSSSSLTPPATPLSPPTTPSVPLPIPSSPTPTGNSATPSTPSKSFNSSLDRPSAGSNTSGGGNKTGAAVGFTIAISFVMLTFLGLAVWFARKREKQVRRHVGSFVMPSLLGASQISESPYPWSPTLVKSSSASHGFPYSPSYPDLDYSKSRFTYEELSDATDGFSTHNLLGEGGFGCVYKGCMPDGREVAVKQLKVGGGQGEREFTAEVEIIGRIHHRHLVSLVGYCISEHQRLLVYDYVPNNTLYYHLHGEGGLVMDWSTRVKVASGAARGISYLHEDCHPRIIHRDIKSSNILLDKNFEAQVSDFGLAKLALDADTHVTTRVMGTFGYLAPEYASSGKLTDKSDVYSFGVVLLELVTGRKPVDSSQPLEDESLVEWARPLMAHALETGDFEDLPDPRLEKNYNESEMFRMIDAAAACVRHSRSMRPRMGQVVRALDGLTDSLDLHNGIKPGQSELFISAQESAEVRLFRRMAFGNQDYSIDFSLPSSRS